MAISSANCCTVSFDLKVSVSAALMVAGSAKTGRVLARSAALSGSIMQEMICPATAWRASPVLPTM